MPDSPGGRAGFAPLDSHQARALAESFGADAQGYDDARPRYPDPLLAQILDRRRTPSVLDVGCGTGIAARQLREAGADVMGVEPDARMAQFARAHGVTVEEGTFESWDAAGRTFDVITAAQSWHWVDPAVGIGKAAGLLRPGGLLAIFGHVFEPPDDIARAFGEAFRRAVPDSPFDGAGRRPVEAYLAGYERIADVLRESGRFAHVDVLRFDWTREYQRDEWLALLATTGGVAPLAVDQKVQVLHAVGAAIDARGGSFTMEYVTLATLGHRGTAA
ncbi:bifunctional 2-polyprenyl-6-hydroxyphenol methylase/3-demethylubiquinol 3-O-methyltransferase UbiG [Tsukamurella sp. PLM1]|uniref:class I SAM-dependent methyltransferase n=1 Tax=Tsukamurella sp. PLM1 TaxID=2929795 RepID=UPI0020537DBF|nr:class I SAM-dependent methyltransferase [Tsukamurella sp. PLM1]BDH56183.1 methyltransferase type 11 [Tsukamurella sp. PLM1]